MPPDVAQDESVHVLDAGDTARRSWLPLLVGGALLLLVAGAGVWIWLDPGLLGGLGAATVQVQAPPPAAGNLLGEAWSFESSESSSAGAAWRVPDEAPAGFSFEASAAVSGALGALADPGDGLYARVFAAKEVSLAGHRGAVTLAAASRSPDVQLIARFEGPGRPPLDVVVASGEGALTGSAPVPPGATAVRAGLGAVGRGAVDDVELRFDDTAAPAQERRGIFDVLALETALLVFRGDEQVLLVHDAAVRPPEGEAWPASVAWLAGSSEIALPGGGRVQVTREAGGDGRRLTRRLVLQGVPGGSVLVRTLHVTGSLAEQPVGIVSARGFEQFTGDFAVEGVVSLVLGRTQDRLAVEFGAAHRLTGVWHADGSIQLRAETPGGGRVELELAVQTSFQDERVMAAQHRDAALAAEAAQRLGEALVEAEIVVTRYPHDEEVTAQVQALRGRVLGRLQERLDTIDGELEDALFLGSAARCREVLSACERAAQEFAGSDAAGRFLERAQVVRERAAALLEEDRARRAARIEAVRDSFRAAGGYPHLADELDAYLAEWLAPEGAP